MVMRNGLSVVDFVRQENKLQLNFCFVMLLSLLFTILWYYDTTTFDHTFILYRVGYLLLFDGSGWSGRRRRFLDCRLLI